MTRDTTALQAVLKHAEGERDAALADLTRLVESQGRLRLQQDQLQTYRREYHERWTAQFRISGGAEVLQHYQGFVVRLNHALDQLAAQMELAERQTAKARDHLMDREMRVAAVRKLIERREADGVRRAAQREQRHTDELAARLAWQRAPVVAL